ncbi:MAG: protein kinase domain-containing protein [Actinomycetota bacterium]
MNRVESDVLLGGRYLLSRRIATGGMGQVWEAEDTVLHRRVAVKVLSEGLSSEPNSAERFRREARAAAGLSHPNVAGVFDYGEDDGTQFIVMELVEGETLADRIGREGRFDPGEAVRIATGIAAALDAAHGAGIVHRDIKPSNVMLTPQGEVRVLDFGIASASGPTLTASGVTIGTAAYLSPEQAAGERATPASDVYALGVVLYEMLAGSPPFTGETAVAVAAAHVSQQPPPIEDVALDVPRHVALACHQALAKDPEQRPTSAAEFARMLRGSDGSNEQTTNAAATAASTPAARDSTTAVLPAQSTAVLPQAAPGGVVGPEQRPGAPARWGPRTNRPAWVLGAALVCLVLLALVLSSLFGGSFPSPNTPTTVRVPNLTGLSLADARQELRRAGLVAGEVRRVEGPDGIVVGTDPPFGASVRRGGTVTLSVGAPPQEEENGEGKGKGKGRGNGGGNGGGGDDD